MAIQIEIVLIAGVAAIGLIVVGKTIIRQFAMRRQPYEAGKPIAPAMSPNTQALPPEG